MKKMPSLLNQIKSKYILQNIFTFAYGDIKSVLRLIKYNKNLIKRLNININDFYNYKLIAGNIKKSDDGIIFAGLIFIIEFFILYIAYMIYIIMYYKHGTFNDNNLREGYDKNKKNFVDIMNKYILLSYFLYKIATNVLTIVLFCCESIKLIGLIKVLLLLFFWLVDLSHYIFYIIKFRYVRKLMKKELLKKLDKGKTSILTWFYSFDLALIVFMSVKIAIYSLFLLGLGVAPKDIDDIKRDILIELNGIKINDFYFYDSIEKSKNELIYKKENIEKYEYELNDNQINLIHKINDIRKQNNIPELEYFKREKVPCYLINPKPQLIFYQKQNIYKISNDLYIFKYPKNEMQILLNNKEIINIIKIDFLNEINVIEQYNNEIISIYNNRTINNVNKLNNNIAINNIELIPIIINSEDKLKNEFIGLSDVNEISEREISNSYK